MREQDFSFSEGLYGTLGEDYKDGSRQIDWILLKEMIENKKNDHDGLNNVEVGLRTDWSYTSGDVWSEGKYLNKDECYAYTASSWAVPSAIFTYNNGFEEDIECWKLGNDSDGWFE